MTITDGSPVPTTSHWNICWNTYDSARVGFEITASPHGSCLPICQSPLYRPGGRTNWSHDELTRHANTIAAAPDLLAAAEHLSTVYDGIWVKISDGEAALLKEAWARMEAAIAKARGVVA
ncbi:hypothetical protein [Azorhizobium doebereinerae]|uniref:hypothetical protein n=1 Tax=Azorhizobium doebereinerae TaxID=281091 RepID=UPI0004243D21|nr:hypothetical protein [Azorhizobium doebereinerae]